MISYKKFIFSICLIIFILSGVVIPGTAEAFSPGVVAVNSGKWVWEQVEKAYDKVNGQLSSDLAYKTVEMFMNSLAYDVATYLAEGGPGGEPLFKTVPIGKSLATARDKALGEFLSELTELGFDELGIDLCSPSLELKLTLTLGLIDTEMPPRPSNCDWRKLQNNWSKFGDNVQADIIKFQLDPRRSGETSAIEFFKNIVSKSGTDVGAAFAISAEVNRRKLEAEKVEEIEYSECQGYLDTATVVTAWTQVTCMTNMNMSFEQWNSAIEASRVSIEEKKKEADGRLSSIMKAAGNKFLDTFTSKLMKNWIKRGMWSLFGSDANSTDYRNTLLDRLRGGANIFQPRNADIFKDFKTINIETIESFDYLDIFAICPDQFRQPDNCVMSPAFLQAINNKLTIQQAIEQGIIDGNMLLVPKDDPVNNSSNKCYRDNLCYTNLVKLRKANIIPVGWELAALRAPVSLQQAMDCFEDGGDCIFGIDETRNEFMVEGNFHNPFYHLVDPDWVLKAPTIRCEAYAFSPVLESPDSSNRQRYCADPKVCLREDSDGNCIEDQFNYCTRSENIWNFEGKICESGEIYAGCLTYSNDDFGVNSYLESSLEYCSADQAGCRRHSQEIDAYGNWVLEDIEVDTNDLFFNRQASECNESNVGCNEYIAMAPDTGANLIPNGDFEIWSTAPDDLPDSFSGLASTVSGEGVNDSNAILAAFRRPAGGSHISACQRISSLSPHTNYTVSVDVKLNMTDEERGDAPARITLDSCNDANGNPGNIFSPDDSMEISNDDPNAPPDEASAYLQIGDISGNYTKFSGTFNTNNSVTCHSICIGSNYGNELPHYFDNLKLEMVTQPSAVSTYTAYGDGARIYMNDDTMMCTADEVGCQGYIPNNGDPMIPAVIVQDDLCPAECVGYETFTEQVDIFDIIEGDNLVEYYNFIPNTAQECPAQEIGCEEFTNLDVVAEGGEGREYFTYLRQCVEESEGTVFYTWEGTDVAGYQIKTWYALESNLDDAPCTNMDPAGGVCQDDSAAEDSNVAVCGAETPDNPVDDPVNDPNCRVFFDEAGAEHYRFQDRVIFATDNCHDYRRSLTGQVYKAVPEESIHCQETNNNCRSYYGNNANNIREVLADNFEDGTYELWQSIGDPLDISNVSLNDNGHSLEAQTGQAFMRDVRNVSLQNDKQYKISWWMRNNAILNSFTMSLAGADEDDNVLDELLIDPILDSTWQNIEPGRWHYYTASVHIDDLDNLEADLINKLDIQINTDATLDDQSLYIDNFTIKEISNNFSVVRNSWDTPLACNQPYDGYHLGCQSYVDLNGQAFDLKSFDHLCRENTIGCMPVIATHNSTNPFEETFNEGDYSELTVLEDNLEYLVPNPNNYCPQAAKGCSVLGIPDRLDETQFTSVYKINDPDKYSSIMCDSTGLNCAEYNTAKGVFYLKDPGAETCTYQQNVFIEGSRLSGWFKTATLGDEIPLGCADTDDNYDTDDDGYYDVRELVLANDYCSVSESDVNQLFYFTKDDCDEANGYWNNFLMAAQCPASENLCTAFRDPVDPVACDPKGINFSFIDFDGHCRDNPTLYTNQSTCESAYPAIPGEPSAWISPSKDGYCSDINYNNARDCNNNGETWTAYCKSYYYYNDENIDETSCDGVVDRQDGCVLFYEANSWNGEHSQSTVIYDAQETYEDIEASNASASPIACNPDFDPTCNLDSNKLIKVSKDRQCAEWLACKSSTASFDDNTNEYKIICDDLDACLEFQYDTDSNTTKCKKWGSYDEDVEALTFEKYQSRDTGLRRHMSWSDKEYTGYSIPNMLAVKDLQVYNFGTTTDNPISRLTYAVTDSVDITIGNYHSSCVDPDDSSIPLVEETCSTEINTDGDYTFIGECHNRICWINPRVNEISTSAYAIEARAYSVADAPFPSAIDGEDLERSVKYTAANICSIGENSCESSFKKVTYGNGQKTLYYPESLPDGETIPPGICTSGQILEDEEPHSCEFNYNCDTNESDGTSRRDGMCSIKTEEIIFRNWPGICLEYDTNNPVASDGESSYYCNQWYPAQKIKGTASLYNNYRGAGYFEQNGRDALFCAVAEAYITAEDRYYCGYFNDNEFYNQCNVLLKVPAGSRVNLDSAAEWPALLESGAWLEADNNDLHPSHLDVGRDIIMPSDKYTRSDNFNDIYPVQDSFMDIINEMFDATDTTEDIHRFYWDEDVRADGHDSSSTFVTIPDETYSFTEGHCETYADPLECNNPDNEHEVYSRKWRSGQCGLHKWRNREIFCNPLESNYYVDLNSGEDNSGPSAPVYEGACGENCKFTSADVLNENHGRGCLQDDTLSLAYSSVLDDYTEASTFDVEECLATVSTSEEEVLCSFIACVESLELNQGNDHLCSLYDTCLSATYSQFTNLSLLSELVYNQIMSCFSDGGTGYNPNNPPEYGDGIGPEVDIYDFEEEEQCLTDNQAAFTDQFTNQVDWAALELFCSQCTYEDPGDHTTITNGTDCDGVNSLDCYQQCRIITHLDSEGLLSAVRTDIWWRSAAPPADSRVRTVPWQSWYWKSQTDGYIISDPAAADDDEVLYGSILGLSDPGNFSHFGAGLGRFTNDTIVATRVPYYNVSNNITAATFFNYMSSPNSDLAVNLNTALSEMQDLFFRVYNLQWIAEESAYQLYGDEATNLGGGNGTNPFAGPEYSPRILATCGDALCETRDNEGNVTAVAEGITINGVNGGNLQGLNSSLFVNVKFFYHAHPDHMPVYSVDVDWGDTPGNNFSFTPGKYKNSLPAKWCNPILLAPGDVSPHTTDSEPQFMGFAGTEDACQDGYKIFYHDYMYDDTGAYACNGAFGTPAKPNIANASCYQPRVRVTDNWMVETLMPFDGWIVVHDG